jgi:hypothetical protein
VSSRSSLRVSSATRSPTLSTPNARLSLRVRVLHSHTGRHKTDHQHSRRRLRSQALRPHPVRFRRLSVAPSGLASFLFRARAQLRESGFALAFRFCFIISLPIDVPICNEHWTSLLFTLHTRFHARLIDQRRQPLPLPWRLTQFATQLANLIGMDLGF